MNIAKPTLLLCGLVTLATLSLEVAAQAARGPVRGGVAVESRHYRSHAPQPRTRVGVGLYFGTPVYGPWWYAPPPVYYYPHPYPYPYPYAYPPAVMSPPVYIERGDAQAPAAPSEPYYWYYCAEADAYYPYVNECPGGWKQVVPHPPKP